MMYGKSAKAVDQSPIPINNIDLSRKSRFLMELFMIKISNVTIIAGAKRIKPRSPLMNEGELYDWY
jgi:hypothetical protein